MSTDVIREFLVSLSWKDDEAGRRRFVESVETATKTVLALGVALEAAAVATAGVVHRIASNFESLYYASSRVGASATNIRAFAYAVSQLGGTADGALASLEAFSRKLRESPGQEAWLKSWGVRTRDAQGELRDSTELMQELVRSGKFQAQPDWLKLRLAEQAGIDERTYRAMLQGLDKFTAEYKKALREAGIDPDAAAKNALKFEQAWRSMFMRMQVAVDSVGNSLMDKLHEPMKRFIELMSVNGPAIVDTVTKLAKGILDAAVWIAQLAERFINFISQYDPIVKKLTGIESAFGAIAAVLFLRLIPGLGSVTALLTALVGGAAWRSLMAVLGMLGMGASAAATGAAGAAAGIGAPALGLGLGMMPGSAGQGEDEFARQDAQRRNPQQRDSRKDVGAWNRLKKYFGFGASARETVEGQPGGATPNKGLRANQQEAYEAALGEGLSDTAARALVANMTGEALHKPGDRHWDLRHFSEGIVQWDPQRAERIRQKFGKYPRHMSVAEQTRAAIWEIRNHPRFNATHQALQGGDASRMINALVRNYEAPAAPGREIALRLGHLNRLGHLQHPNMKAAAPIGHSSVTSHSFASHLINQKNTYNITEAGSAGATARAVGSVQSRTNSELIRNLQGAAR